MRVAAAFLLSALALVAPAQSPRDNPPPTSSGTATITGRVVAADTGDVIRKARVTAEAVNVTVTPVFTDVEGRFAIGGLPPGRYVVTAVKAGYSKATLGIQSPGDRATRVDVAAGAQASGIDLQLSKAAAI